MNKNVKKLVLMSILAAMSCVLYLVPKFPLPFFPSFLEINFSMLPIFICGFVLGMKEGFIVVILRFLIKLVQSHTAGVGEIADLVIGGVTVVLTTFIYNQTKKDTKGLIISLLIGIGVWIVTAVLANAFFLLPMYIKLYFDGNVQPLLGMLKVIPGVTIDNYQWKYVIFAVIPFNMIIAVMVCIVTFFVQKRLKFLIEE